MYSKVYSFGLMGLVTYKIEIESDIARGLPAFDIVGLPDTSVKESKNRTRSALKNTGFDFPVSRITINLAPAHIKKEGPLYDLPILISILLATNQLTADLSDAAFIGELSLQGELRPVRGVLPMAICASESGVKRLFIPAENACETTAVAGITVFPVRTLAELLSHLLGDSAIEPVEFYDRFDIDEDVHLPDFSEVKGQYFAKRALEVAAAGGHNILLIGPPGSGKSMLAKRLPGILPDMTFDEMIETTKIHSVAGTLTKNTPLITSRPFRSPHHTISPSGLSGGGAIPRPGEISLSHNGVLFLDELPEFSRPTMEILRQPIEDGSVTISRVAGTLTYPSSMMLVAAMNPCPCGFFSHPSRPCTCPKKSVSKYLNKISGPLLDRIDIHAEVPPVVLDQLIDKIPAESSAEIKKRVMTAREIQRRRFEGTKVTCNARMTPKLFAACCAVEGETRDILAKAFDTMGLSARAYDRILKVARTIADLEASADIRPPHIREALQYRNLDRKYWQGGD